MSLALARVVAVALLSLGLAACGGKILDDGAGAGGATSAGPNGASSGGSGAPPSPSSSSSAAPSEGQPPSSPLRGDPSGGKPSVADACATVCQRNARCGASQSDCVQQCADEIGSVTACGAPANAYIQCYASNLGEGCAALPPVCEDAYCAYTRCAGKVVPTYCP